MSPSPEKKNSMRREKLAGYFFDISKLSFAGMVISGLTILINGKTTLSPLLLIAFGAIATYIFAYIANRLLK